MDVKVAPLLRHDLLSHDAYTCAAYARSRPFPTRRRFDFQHVGQVFDASNAPRFDDVDAFLRGAYAPAACRRRPDWVYG